MGGKDADPIDGCKWEVGASSQVWLVWRMVRPATFVLMKKLLILLFLAVTASASAQTVHDFASVEFSPGIRKLGVFSTSMPNKVVDLKPLNMDKRELDMGVFFQEVQEMEKQGWEVTSQDVVALDKGVHMYVWSLRKSKP